MTPSSKRFSGQPPICPATLDDPPPTLTKSQLEVPTSELYSAALEDYYRTKGKSGEHRTSTSKEEKEEEEDGVDRYEPDPTREDRPNPKHYGLYARERATLDWSYHVVPSRARQSLQDSIVSKVLGRQVKECSAAGDDELCRINGGGDAELGCQLGDCSGENGESDEGKPLALFTAG